MYFKKFIAIIAALVFFTGCTQKTKTDDGVTKKGSDSSAENFDEILAKYKTDVPTKILTPNHVKTSIGELEFYDGMPTQKTLNKV